MQFYAKCAAEHMSQLKQCFGLKTHLPISFPTLLTVKQLCNSITCQTTNIMDSIICQTTNIMDRMTYQNTYILYNITCQTSSSMQRSSTDAGCLHLKALYTWSP